MKKILLLLLIISSILNANTKISKKAYKSLQKAQELTSKKSYSQAIAILNPIAKSTNIQEKVYAYQALSNIYIERNNYKKASFYIEKIIKAKTLEKKELDKMKFSLAKIYLSSQNYKKALSYLLSLRSSAVKKSELNEYIALSYYYSNQFSKSVPYIKKTIPNQKNKENWYRMLYSAQIEARSYQGAISTLKLMLKKYTKNQDYWMQLISLYQKQKLYKKSLATIELAYNKGIVNKKKNIMYFVNILLQNKLYNKAGFLVEKSIKKGILQNNSKNFQLLISSFLNAKNFKKSTYYLKNSSFAKTSRYQLILGDMYYNKALYSKAINALKNYSFKRGSKADGQRNTLIALSYYELNDKNQAMTFLKKAAKNSYEKKRAFSIAQSLGYKI